MQQGISGLTESQVIARREQGQGNAIQFAPGRTYLQILRKNAFTFINCVLFAIGILLILMGQMDDAVVTAGLVLMNVIVGVYQEGRAKRKLDQLALLTRPRATVIRDAQEQAVDPDELVLGDVLVARPGDQIVVDGEVIGGGRMEVDESLLTGESEHIVKTEGDAVSSGSFCVIGSALYEAQRVGAESTVNQMTAGARAFRQVKTPLQRDIDLIIRILVLLVTQLGILLGISFLIQGLDMVEGVRMAAVIVALVPQGLFFMTTVAYAMGALRVAGQGALIQESNAVESTSHVNLLCLDKTGTLTTNRIQLETVYPLDGVADSDEGELRRILGHYAASAAGGTRTTAAIQQACGGQPLPVAQEVPFASERKWSALAFDAATVSGSGSPVTDLAGIYVLGAPEVLSPYLGPHDGLAAKIDEWTARGLRVVLFARHPGPASLHDDQGEPQVPVGLAPLALLSLSDELRPEAQETLQHFADLGIEPKIISGDNPRTVAALARQVGLAADLQATSGLELAAMDEAQLDATAEASTIFGRITPQQKEGLVRRFGEKGYYVAMIGDGVNDVLSLKQAHLGIAMQSGSQATRSVADLVLMNDSFAALPIAFREGQRIVKGMEDVVRLLLTRTFYVLLLMMATQLVGVPFPVTPKHNSILALLTVGIPILALAAWARPGPPPRSVVRSTSHFVFPAAFTVSVVALAVYLAYLAMGDDLEVARTALTTVTIFCGLLLIPFVEPPTGWWVAGDVLSGDRRPALLALGMLLLFGLIMLVPPLRGFFELTLLRPIDYLLLAALAAGWALLLLTLWRTRFFERLLSP
ncbi:MAG: HAD-IC family P-type ATPase [Anaerolineae bacterium]|jgi:cation-transporting ATPase E